MKSFGLKPRTTRLPQGAGLLTLGWLGLVLHHATPTTMQPLHPPQRGLVKEQKQVNKNLYNYQLHDSKIGLSSYATFDTLLVLGWHLIE
ncbi:hypothetical protein [Nostoc sp. LPT]|uniref:hypothetical protein n=2 Tax=Nostoc TaxID=1177 RepID=UPI0025D9C87D|nr:hypothetical protein [Nostoc sp. LPT]